MRTGLPTVMSVVAGGVCLLFNGNSERNRTANRVVTKSVAIQETTTATPSTFRIATFNAKFLPFMPTNRKRAKVLANRIKTSAYDIVVLNEVFSESARKILTENLAVSYPHMVTYIGSQKQRDDSGLMLISKFPFNPMHNLEDNGTQFWEFAACKGTDCLAGKGVAHVPLRVHERTVHVFFTHLQATYSRHTPAQDTQTRLARGRQLEDIAHFISNVLAQDQTGEGATLIVGDLNVDGSTNLTGSRNEWIKMMETLSEPFSTDLIDVWERHAPAGNPGLTYPATQPSVRYDYVLLNNTTSPQKLCVHNVSLAPHLAEGYRNGKQTRLVSDHIGLVVELDLRRGQCTSQDALPKRTGLH